MSNEFKSWLGLLVFWFAQAYSVVFGVFDISVGGSDVLLITMFIEFGILTFWFTERIESQISKKDGE